ncbi:MAG TPA: tetratricopeptide repeat protein [Bryobacteraceae bacterium]|nr:tetratricopeptide repeat protein [Bryobacteraceae bacterium]
MLCRILANSLLSVVLFAPLALRAQSGSGDDPRVQELYGQARAAQSHGDLAGAIAKYEEILKIAPRLGPAYNNLGALYFRQREFQKAAKVLEAGLKISPGMPSASALLGISLYEMGEYAKARPLLEAALRANPGDKNAQLYLVHDLTELGDYEAAESHLRQLAGREPKDQETWYLLAKTYMRLSEQALAKMNAIDPNSVVAHELSGEMMEAMNNFDGAVVQLKKAVEMAPQRPGTHYKLGGAYLGLSDLDSAMQQFRAELTVDPGSCRAWWKVGMVVLQKNGNADEALTDINKAFAMCPDLNEARVDRARALAKLNRNAEAAADLEIAVKADPSEPSTHFLLARVYRALGRTQEAQAEMQTYSKLDASARAATAERAQEVIKNKQTAH